jgi:hypothetical protein
LIAVIILLLGFREIGRVCEIPGSYSAGYEEYSYSGIQRLVGEFRLPLAFTLVSYSPYSSTLKMEGMCSSETSVDFQRATLRYIPEGSTLGKVCFGTLNSLHFYQLKARYRNIFM